MLYVSRLSSIRATNKSFCFCTTFSVLKNCYQDSKLLTYKKLFLLIFHHYNALSAKCSAVELNVVVILFFYFFENKTCNLKKEKVALSSQSFFIIDTVKTDYITTIWCFDNLLLEYITDIIFSD